MRSRTRTTVAAGAALALTGALLLPAGAVTDIEGTDSSEAGGAAAPGATRTHSPTPAEPARALDDVEDNRPGPLSARQDALRRKAITKVAAGDAQPDADGVVRLGKNTFAETKTVKRDVIFTVLAEFGDESVEGTSDAPGPRHNEIPKPDRTVDNSTIWREDFSPASFEELFNGDGESMRTYYEDVSNGQYSVTNEVTDWVQVPYNAAYYGDNNREEVGGAWDFVAHSVDAWWTSRIEAGASPEELKAELAKFDVWDRYDFDNDGDFDEPDGYIDHFQAVHAGEGEEAGGGALGGDAIWSHRWYVNGSDYGLTGPVVGDTANSAGGTEIGSSGIWVGDYTTEPENGGLGVFAHEYAHDLGLPDYYDTAGGENGTAFWTLMSAGSWLSHGAKAGEGIGTTPGLMGPEEKLFLGWLDYKTVPLGKRGMFTLSPSQFHVRGKEQAVKVDLPSVTTSTEYTTPASGECAWWTGSADSLNESLSRAVPAAGEVEVSAQAWYDIEENYDGLYGEYSLDGGTTWQRAGDVVDGTTEGEWTTIRFAYDAGGAASQFRFRYQTDGGLHLPGAFLDDIVIASGGTELFTDDVEDGENGWSASGLWEITTGTITGTHDRYYLVENRQYAGWDRTLKTGPYQFSKALTAPSWVEHFPFQDGMLVWYVDHSYEDNNTVQHPGAGNALVVDARPAPFTYDDGTKPANRRQAFDATFGLQRTDRVCLHKEVAGPDDTVVTKAACQPSTRAIPTFTDSDPNRYWSAANPLSSVKVAGHGVKVTVAKEKRWTVPSSLTKKDLAKQGFSWGKHGKGSKGHFWHRHPRGQQVKDLVITVRNPR